MIRQTNGTNLVNLAILALHDANKGSVYLDKIAESVLKSSPVFQHLNQPSGS